MQYLNTLRSKVKLPSEVIQFLVLFLISVIFTYFTPQSIKNAFFLFILLMFWRSEKNYLWIVFAFVITDYIGYFFFFQLNEIIKFGPADLSFLDLFAIFAFAKVLRKRNKRFNIFKPSIKIYLSFLILLFFLGIVYGLNDRTNYFNISKMLLLFTLFYSVPHLLNFDKNEILKISSLFFISLLINLFGQFYNIFFIDNINTALGGKISEDYALEGAWQFLSIIRPVCGFYTIFMALFFALFYRFSKIKSYSSAYLNTIIILSFISVIITATRGWLIAFVIIALIILVFASFSNKIKLIKLVSASIIMIAVIITLNKGIRQQIILSWDRLSTVELIFKGDPTAGGTNVRLTSRSEAVMEKFYEKPILGWGFSDEGMAYNDIHTGNQTILLTGGVAGVIVMLLMLFMVVKNINKCYKYVGRRNPFKNSFLIIIAFLVGLLVIHSTSTQIFGYLTFIWTHIHKNKLYFLILFFHVINMIIYIALREERTFKEIN